MARPELTRFESVDAFNLAATDFITEHIQEGLNSSGTADIFLSGGSTPKAVYENLSQVLLDWKNVNVGQVDERWVGLESSGSNAAFIRRTLLRNTAKSANFTRMKSRHQTALAGRDAVEGKYGRFCMDKSLAVLGMGTDGHIAGWFPQSGGLELAVNPQNPNRIATIHATQSKVTGPFLERITLTLSALSQCSKLLLLTSGDEKLKVLEQALETQSETYPISHLLKNSAHTLTFMHAG